MYRWVYGPVASRRLGLSLGIDLTGHKVCSMDCVYCECGATTLLTTERKEYVPISEVLAELKEYFAHSPEPDYLSLSGSGEPTLNIRMGELLRQLRELYPRQKTALITNSTLLHLPEVRAEALEADVLVPSLDGVTSKAVRLIDRVTLDIDALIDGIASLSEQARVLNKPVWLEIFLIEGINTSEQNWDRFAQAIRYIQPTRVQLNTLDRPGTSRAVRPVPYEMLQAYAQKLGGLLDEAYPVDIPSRRPMDHARKAELLSLQDIESSILNSLLRRSATMEDLLSCFALSREDLELLLERMLALGVIEQTSLAGQTGTFYTYQGPRHGR